MINKRKSIRLADYDYSESGAYFITVCTAGKGNALGEIINGEFVASETSKIVERYWLDLTNHYDKIILDEYVVMPDHFHGIIIIVDDYVGAMAPTSCHELPLQERRKRRRRMLLPKIIGRFKMQSAKMINTLQRTEGKPFWQNNYFERVIRDEKEMDRVREYISDNPVKREIEKGFPENILL